MDEYDRSDRQKDASIAAVSFASMSDKTAKLNQINISLALSVVRNDEMSDLHQY